MLDLLLIVLIPNIAAWVVFWFLRNHVRKNLTQHGGTAVLFGEYLILYVVSAVVLTLVPAAFFDSASGGGFGFILVAALFLAIPAGGIGFLIFLLITYMLGLSSRE